MAEKLNFQIFHGQGEIVYGPQGVDLSQFRSMIKGIDRAAERKFSAVHNYLFRGFKLDPQQHDMRIMAVVSRPGGAVYWELVPLEGTQNWRDYVRGATHRGMPLVLFVQVYLKNIGTGEMHDDAEEVGQDRVGEDDETEDESVQDEMEGETSAPRELEPTGEVDEGELIPEVVEQMEREDRDHIEALEDDSSDEDDGVAVPAQWSSYDYSQLTVNEGERVPWEYRENEVCLGALYPSGDAVKEAVQRWSAMSLRRQFRVHKSSPNLYDVKCVKDNCPFRVHAYRGKWTDYWEVSRITEHTCELLELETQHRNLTASFVANHMYAQIVDNPSYEPRSVMRVIEEKFKYKISYSKAYRTK